MNKQFNLYFSLHFIC